MRTFTEKDKRGLLVALRVFVRNLSGERISQQAGGPLIDKALEAGITVDALLNKGNWQRATKENPDLKVKDYINMLCERTITVLPLKAEENWHLPENGFAIVAEATHDFFMEVADKGGKWNIPSALVNLATAIRSYGLQAILSEDLIEQVMKTNGYITYFYYIHTLIKDFYSLNIEKEEDTTEHMAPTEKAGEQENKNQEEAFNPEPPVGESEEEENQPEEEPYPEESVQPGFETFVITQANPNETKSQCVKSVLMNYNVQELLGIVKTMENGFGLTLNEVVENLVAGRFDAKLEDADTKKLHQEINADLTLPFIDCVNMQGIQMNQELAASYDILSTSWDLREFKVRKCHKLLKLIFSEGKDDPDLLAAAEDIEKMYSEKE